MKKTILILAFAAFPCLALAQVSANNEVVVIEEFGAREQKLMDLEKKHRDELNQSLDRTLDGMSDKQTKVLANFIKGNEKKKAKISDNLTDVIEINGEDKAAVKKYFNDSLKSEVYMPWTEPEVKYEVDITE